jgi:hypothetical protein
MSTIDLSLIPENVPSLCIPRVFNNIDRERVFKCFRDLNLGHIDRIDMVRSRNPDDKFQRVFVHLFWNNTEDSRAARMRLLQGGEIKIIYDEPWFWKVSVNRSKPREDRDSHLDSRDSHLDSRDSHLDSRASHLGRDSHLGRASHLGGRASHLDGRDSHLGRASHLGRDLRRPLNDSRDLRRPPHSGSRDSYSGSRDSHLDSRDSHLDSRDSHSGGRDLRKPLGNFIQPSQEEWNKVCEGVLGPKKAVPKGGALKQSGGALKQSGGALKQSGGALKPRLKLIEPEQTLISGPRSPTVPPPPRTPTSPPPVVVTISPIPPESHTPTFSPPPAESHTPTFSPPTYISLSCSVVGFEENK